MDLNRLSLFSFFSQRMNWLGERQKVLAENIANADTPKFASRDLKPFDVKAAGLVAGRRIGLAVSDPAHAAGLRPTSSSYGTMKNKPTETTISGNTVSLDSELMKSAETAMDYQLVTNLYRKQLGMIRSVLSRGSS